MQEYDEQENEVYLTMQRWIVTNFGIQKLNKKQTTSYGGHYSII